LIPLDAPTQPRTYLAPSSTAPKDLPHNAFAVTGKKRSHDELAASSNDDQPSEDPSDEKERLEAKRRKNALSARKSRQLKKETKESLEAEVARLTQERDHWQALAEARGQQLVQLMSGAVSM